MIINKKRRLAFPLILAGAFSWTAPLRAAPTARAQWLMGTVCEITTYGPHKAAAETAAFAEIARWDRILSLYKRESELSILNREASRAPFACSPSLWEALGLAADLAKASGGAFDPTILPVLKEGPAALERVGFSRLVLDADKRTVYFPLPAMGLDFGGLGKGLALDHAARVLREHGVQSALINFGGQILAFGAPPGLPGWTVKVPGQERDFIIRDASVSTSGNEEKPGHIASPFTGRAVLDGKPVTVIAPTAAAADAWSTALFVLGRAPSGFDTCALSPGQPPSPACSIYLEHHHKGASK